jgi:c-di-GMP-binding flagellar brake protein YcgR
MAKLTRGGGGSRPQKRQYRRFSLHYPVDVKFDLGTSVTELRTFSSNISLGGVLLQSDSAIPQHCDVSFVVTVRRHQIVGPIQIIGEGEVVRVEPHSSGTGFTIAVKCKRPISELQAYLPASAS